MARDASFSYEAFAVELAKGSEQIVAWRLAFPKSRANDNTASKEAHKLAKRPDVVARVAALRATAVRKAELSVERTLKEVARLAYFDPRTLYREDGQLKRPDEWDDDTAAAVASVEVGEEYEGKGEDRVLSGYTKKLKLWDKNAALEKAMKHLGLFEKDNEQQRENLVLRVEAATPVKR